MLRFVYETCTMAVSLRHTLYFGNANKTCEISTNKFCIVWLHIFTAVRAPFSKLKCEPAPCPSVEFLYAEYNIYTKYLFGIYILNI